MRGQIHIYTGNGKGKTTAAVGLAVRAAGSGKQIFLGQFMKGMEYSEIKMLRSLPQIEIQQFGWEECISKDDVTDFHRKLTADGFRICCDKITSGNYDLVILDEIVVSIWFGLIAEQAVINFLEKYSGAAEVVLTGRYASEALLANGDLITEMKCVRHYWEKGVEARDGIER